MSMLTRLFSKADSDHLFEKLIQPHVDHLYRLAYHLTQSVDDAEDLVQEVLVKLYPRCNEILKLDQPRPWLAKVLYRQFVDSHRKQTRSPVSKQNSEVFDEEEGIIAFASSHPEPEQVMDSANLSLQLQTALDELNLEHKTLVILHYVEGYTLSELQSVLDLPIGTLKSRLHRIKAALKVSLNFSLKEGTFCA